jgi:hypothetical protein
MMGMQTPTSTCCRRASVTCMPSAPPAQDPEIPVSCCAASNSSSYVGTYGGLNKRISTACSRRLVNGRASDATSGSSETYIQYNIIHDTAKSKKVCVLGGAVPCFGTRYARYMLLRVD